MNFITGLPKSKGKEVIWVVVDRFSRYSHFIALTHPITAKSLAMEFFDQIYRIHGLPETIVVYGSKPRHLAWQDKGDSNIHSLETLLAERQLQWARLRELLEVAQAKLKSYADTRRSEMQFQKGDWVYLKLQPYKQVYVVIRRNLKLAAKFYGPYEIVEKVGSVAYKLALPVTSRIHPVFHVSQLKKDYWSKCLLESGDGAKLVRDAFQLAKEKSPCIIFIDAIGTKRFDSEVNGDREVQRTMLELLNQLDGFGSDDI
ncbi:uncharacterized protein LOC141715031 [Apium graveolens]|uniref:uncharacterized protein LOC141715031 n=1 Tax=Apium graveolens TaxID=4045 RepID=UPI003D791377